MKIRRVKLVSTLAFVVLLLLQFSTIQEVEAMYLGEDRYKPQTCKAINKEGETYDKAICEKVIIDGPCVDEVKCVEEDLGSEL